MTRTAAIVVVVGVIVCVAPIARAQRGAAPPARVTGSEDTPALTAGWAALAAGDSGKASMVAAAVLVSHPRSAAAGALLVEAEIARGGSAAGLQAYERWLADRRLEDGYLLRRVARAQLWEFSDVPEVKVDALQHLASDGDARARAILAGLMVKGDLASMRALAKTGDEAAVNRLIETMKQNPGSRSFFIDALIESRSPLAIAPLTGVLDDANRPADVARAADGLGKLAGTSAIPNLRKLLADKTYPYPLVVAGALFRLSDGTGLPMLQKELVSEASTIRARVAEYMSAAPDQSWQGVVRGLVTDANPDNRLTAAKLIAPYELELARQTFEALLLDENPAIRQMAGIAIAERTAVDFSTLRRLLRQAEAPIRVRTAGRVLELSR
ncbi:MAG TPA: hypothetical protein VN700_04110 [Vicinamibacterales bacterium]|nr:hypothetical protein [Vicinamibacterales bacterium]